MQKGICDTLIPKDEVGMSRKKWIWIVIASVWLFAVFYGLLKTTGVIALTAKHSEIDPELLSLWGLDSSDQEHAFQEQTTYASSFQVPQITSPPVIRSAEQLIPEGTWHLVYAFFRGDSTRHSYDYGDRIIAVESDSRHGVITSSADTDALRFVVENRNGVDVMASYEWSLYEYVIEGDFMQLYDFDGNYFYYTRNPHLYTEWNGRSIDFAPKTDPTKVAGLWQGVYNVAWNDDLLTSNKIRNFTVFLKSNGTGIAHTEDGVRAITWSGNATKGSLKYNGESQEQEIYIFAEDLVIEPGNHTKYEAFVLARSYMHYDAPYDKLKEINE